MKELTENGKQRLDKYINEVKFSLKGCKSVEPDDIIADIYEYVDGELAEINEPVSIEDIEKVLKKLGNPGQWVSDEDISWWRKIVIRLQNGPDDWRLAYISFGIFVLAMATLVTGVGFIIFMPISFYISRMTLGLIKDDGEAVNQKILLYPSLCVTYVIIACCLLVWPLVAVFGAADGLEHADINAFPWKTGNSLVDSEPHHSNMPYWWVANIVAYAVTSFWLLFVGMLHKSKPAILEFCFKPFGAKLKSKWVNVYITVTLLMTILFSVASVLMIRFDGWYDYLRNIGR